MPKAYNRGFHDIIQSKNGPRKGPTFTRCKNVKNDARYGDVAFNISTWRKRQVNLSGFKTILVYTTSS